MKSDNFTIERFNSILRDMQNGRNNVDRMTVGDGVQESEDGLRAILRKDDGTIRFVVRYSRESASGYFNLGSFPELDINGARERAARILALAESGVDPDVEMREQFFRGMTRQ